MKNILYTLAGLVLLASVGVVSTVHAETISTASCPNYIHSFLKRDAFNNREEVIRLQIFLKVHEGSDVDVSGVFDAKTEAAVSTFQLKYKDIILAPWGATRPSGTVHVTTSKQINKLVCGQPMTLDIREKAIIDTFVAGRSRGTMNASATATSNTNSNIGNSKDLKNDDNTNDSNISVEATSPIIVTTFTASSSARGDDNKSTDDNSGNMNTDIDTGTRVKISSDVSLSARFWSFIRSIFVR